MRILNRTQFFLNMLPVILLSLFRSILHCPQDMRLFECASMKILYFYAPRPRRCSEMLLNCGSSLLTIILMVSVSWEVRNPPYVCSHLSNVFYICLRSRQEMSYETILWGIRNAPTTLRTCLLLCEV
jgi:hypothetical protein